MHKIRIAVLLLTLLNGCKKNSDMPESIVVDLTTISTNTPTSSSPGFDIISNVTCSGPDLCHRFHSFEIKETSPRQFEIKAKGSFPNSKNGDIICLQAVYYKDTTVKIHAATRGQYILKFLNNNQLFKTDTVQVN